MASESPEYDTFLDQCRDHHRRIILGVFAGQERSLTALDLAKAIVKHNHHKSPEEVSGETIDQILLSLRHRHIPKLVAGNLVTYDSTRQLVEPTEQFTRWQPTLSAIIDADPSLEPPVAL